MTKITRFMCDTCGEEYDSQGSIFYCEECHAEMCEDCCSPEDDLCWECMKKAKETSKE